VNCVSYTRDTCCHPAYEPAVPIRQQEEYIQSYLHKKGWKLIRQYSDDSSITDNSNAFEKMKSDGLRHCYDCLILYSMFQCGDDVYQIVKLLRHSFYPAGIQFIVVKDDFCSLEHDKTEVFSYLQDKESDYHGNTAKDKMGKHTLKHHMNTYGFRYDEEKNRLTVDEKSAAVVKEVFQLLADGWRAKAIAELLTKRNEENPSDYRFRINGTGQVCSFHGWKPGTVNHLANNKKFCGEWSSRLKDYGVQNDCPPIIEPELFQKVHMILSNRNFSTKKKPPLHNPITNVPMRDKESGLEIFRMKVSRKNEYTIRFKYPKNKEVFYEKPFMSYDEFIPLVEECLRNEKERCRQVIERLESGEAEGIKNKMIESIRAQSKEIMEDIHQSEMERIHSYIKYKDGNSSLMDYQRMEDLCVSRFQELSGKLEGIIDEINNVNKAFSRDNPWIKLISTYDDTIPYQNQHRLDKYIRKIVIYRFEKVEIIFKEAEWRDKLPGEWMEG